MSCLMRAFERVKTLAYILNGRGTVSGLTGDIGSTRDAGLHSADHVNLGGGDMKHSCLSDRHSSGATLSLFVISVTIAAIFCTFSFAVIETSHAAGWRAQAIFEPLKAENHDGFYGRISNRVGSWIQNKYLELGASFLPFRQKSLKAYRYRHEQYKMLKMVMGWILIPIFYILKYPKVSLFLFFLVTVFLAILDELLYRYKRYPSLSEESKSVIESFYRGTHSQLLK